MRVFKIQPSSFTDQVGSDGTEFTKRPYPIIVDETGLVLENPLVTRVIGFVRDLARQEIDIHWSSIFGRPTTHLVGKYIIVQDPKGGLSTLATAVETFEELPSVPEYPPVRTEAMRDASHAAHCCLHHGCKYGSSAERCGVLARRVAADGSCQGCAEDAEAQPTTKQGLRTLLSDFAAEVAIDLERDPPDWSPRTEACFERIAGVLGIRR